jgi:hypothetical protein
LIFGLLLALVTAGLLSPLLLGKSTGLTIFTIACGIAFIATPIVYYLGWRDYVKSRGSKGYREEEFAQLEDFYNDDTKNRLANFLADKHAININYLTWELQSPGVDQKMMRLMLYEMAGEGLISGEFTDDQQAFLIFTPPEEFISALDAKFREWASREADRSGKSSKKRSN